MILEDSDVQRLAVAIAAHIKADQPGLKFLGLQDAADSLDCSLEHIRALIAAGHLEAIDISEDGEAGKRRAPRVAASSIEKFAKARKV